MTPVMPQESGSAGKLTVFGEDQPEYLPLPAFVTPDGEVITEWEPTAEELALLMSGGRVRLTQLTFNTKLQPVKLEVR